MKPAMAIPFDIKLMNMTTVVLFLVFGAVSVVALARGLARSSAFAIHTITVSGEVSHNNPLTLRANVAPRLSGTFFTVDLARVRAAFESVPWVRHAVVRRNFPNQLQVELQEHHAVAYWGTDSEQRLMNSYGEVFEANAGEVEQDGLPQLNGPEGQGADVLAMYRVLAPMFQGMEMPIEQLELTRGGSWRAHLDTAAVIELGRGSTADVVARTQRFLKTLVQVTARYARRVNAVESADLRHESGYAIRLRGVSTVTDVVTKK